MKTISRRPLALLTAALLAATSALPAFAADPTPPAPVIPVAHSALLTVDATTTADGIALHVRHAGNQIPIDGRDVTVSVDGRSQPVTPAPEGTFLMSTKELTGEGERQIEIVVAHD